MQGKVECWFEFCSFGERFSVYYSTFCFEVYNHHSLKTKQQKNICIEEKVIIQINFNPGLPLAGFRTFLPGFQQVNITWARDPIENQDLASDMVTWYWSADTLFWQVSLSVTWMSNIKKVNDKPRLRVSVNLLLGVWPPSCATPSSSWSCVRAHGQYR